MDRQPYEPNYAMEMGVQSIGNKHWKHQDCNSVQLENGFIVTTKAITQDEVIFMDHAVIADHYGNRIYEKGENIKPVKYISLMS